MGIVQNSIECHQSAGGDEMKRTDEKMGKKDDRICID